MGYYINFNFVKSLQLPMEELRSPITVKNVNETENITGKITHFIHLRFTIQQRDQPNETFMQCSIAAINQLTNSPFPLLKETQLTKPEKFGTNRK